MEAAIEAAEARKAAREARLVDPAVYTSGAKVAELQRELEAAAAEVDRLYVRWQELQDLAAL
jgi:ATP-binding cassette subfamily F protein uup